MGNKKNNTHALPYNAIACVLSIFIIFFINTQIYAADNDISWSSSNKAITDEQFKNIIFSNMNLSVDVLNENFDSYTSTSSNFNYTRDILNSYLNNSSYTKAFMNYDNKLVVIFGSNKIQLYYDNYPSTALPKKYFLNTSAYMFDFDNKTINYFNTQQQYPFYDLGWWLDGTDITQAEFETTAYKQNMIYETFFLVLGPIYDNVDTSRILNSTRSYKVDGNMYEGLEYTGEIVFSEEFESWQTRNLSESFTSGEYYYFIDAFYYDESGVSANNLGTTQRIGEGTITFNEDSVYLPSVVEVNKAIKQFDGYMNYAYNIVLTKVGSNDELFLSSDLFIVDGKPIAMIPYFRYKYDYIYYGNYIDISESGDNGSGDNSENNLSETNNLIGNVNAGIEDLNNNLTNVPDLSGEIITGEEITESLGFEVAADPYDNFWYEITTGLGNALTQNKRSVSVNFRNKTYTIDLDDFAIQIPEAISGFTETLCIVFISWIMLKYIKISVDMISSGNIDTLLQMNEEEGIVDLF